MKAPFRSRQTERNALIPSDADDDNCRHELRAISPTAYATQVAKTDAKFAKGLIGSAKVGFKLLIATMIRTLVR